MNKKVTIRRGKRWMTFRTRSWTGKLLYCTSKGKGCRIWILVTKVEPLTIPISNSSHKKWDDLSKWGKRINWWIVEIRRISPISWPLFPHNFGKTAAAQPQADIEMKDAHWLKETQSKWRAGSKIQINCWIKNIQTLRAILSSTYLDKLSHCKTVATISFSTKRTTTKTLFSPKKIRFEFHHNFEWSPEKISDDYLHYITLLDINYIKERYW